ncbi:CDP-glycerol glycerophosphotransferase family protein [Pseudodesulfovibrio sp.]|nr:CDP-glycerol glycerophosphotransferase family protein [Pseudodesulfovibrio sp.]
MDPREAIRKELEEHVRKTLQAQALYTTLAEKTEKKENKFLFIGRAGGDFSGNVKYLYLHFVKNHPEIDSAFLTQQKEVYRTLREAGLPVILTPSTQDPEVAEAGTVIVDAVSFRRHLYYPMVENARQVQLWHGVGNKKIGFLLEGISCLEGKDETLIEDHSNYDVIVSTSPFYTEEVFKKSLHAKEFVSLGYPRTDALFNKLDKHTLIGCDPIAYSKVRQASKKGPVILFSPTFRDNGVNPLTQGVLDYNELFAFLKRTNAHLLVKAHTRTPLQFGTLPDNVTICESTSDIYPFLPLIDVMITDYSSIYTEYLLLDRPVLFFWKDFAEYMSHDRGFQFPFEEMCPGPKCRTAEQLFEALAAALEGEDEWKDARRAMRDKAFLHTEGGACERIAELLLKKP